MSQQLVINKKRYFPSTELARKYSYTSDYISKLARDEKVLGTRVGRQWFIEPESLRTYIQQLDVEKQIQKEDLSRQRKLERLQPTIQSSLSVRSEVAPALMSLTLALLVLSCGLLSGYIGFVAYQDGVRFSDLAFTIKHWTEGAATHTVAGSSEIVRLAQLRPSPTANSFLSEVNAPPQLFGVGPQLEVGRYAQLPELSRGSSTPAVSAYELSSAIARLEESFSDDVTVSLVDGELLVQPVSSDVSVEPYRLSEILSGRVNQQKN